MITIDINDRAIGRQIRSMGLVSHMTNEELGRMMEQVRPDLYRKAGETMIRERLAKANINIKLGKEQENV